MVKPPPAGILPVLHFCRKCKRFVEKVVDSHRRSIEWPVHGVVAADMAEPLLLREAAHLLVEPVSPDAVSLEAAMAVEPFQLGMRGMDVVQNILPEAAAEVEVLKPYEIAVRPGAQDDGAGVGDAGEDGGDGAGRPDARLVDGLHASRRRPMEAALSMSRRKSSSRVLMEKDTAPGEGLDELEVAQHAARLGGDAERAPAALHLFQQGPRAAEAPLQRLVGIRDGAQEKFLAGMELRPLDRWPALRVRKGAQGSGWLLKRFMKDA